MGGVFQRGAFDHKWRHLFVAGIFSGGAVLLVILPSAFDMGLTRSPLALIAAGFLEVLVKPLPAAAIQGAVRRVLGLPYQQGSSATDIRSMREPRITVTPVESSLRDPGMESATRSWRLTNASSTMPPSTVVMGSQSRIAP